MAKVVLVLAAAAAASLLLYHAYALHTLQREIATTPRDPRTGVVLGTEALSLEALPHPSRACLLVHGWMGSRLDFHDLGERLAAQGFYVRLLRLPGHGTTPAELSEMDASDLLEGVRNEFLDLRQRFDEVDVVGFSLGGALAACLASQEPVDRLVLAAPFFKVAYHFYYILPPETWGDLLGPVLPYVVRSRRFVQVNRREARDALFSYKAVPVRSVKVLCGLGRTAGAPDLLGRIRCPVLVLHSTGDMAASFQATEDAFGKIGSPQKRFVPLEASNHQLFWDFDRERVMDEIGRFLAGGR